MSGATLQTLPEAVVDVLEESVVSEFATVSTAGVPIDTPTYCFPSDDLASIGVATGIAYPVKADRARRNPKVGLLIEGLPGKPVISIRGLASVRDADLEANARRYLAETGFEQVAHGMTWEQARKAVWYWTRIIIDVTPVRVMWWDNAESMEHPPQRWDAPEGTTAPPSDPPPVGKSTKSQWTPPDWPPLAAAAAARGTPSHFTICDADGWPLPICASNVEADSHGFLLSLPAGIPWDPVGQATLTFAGLETFVGVASREDGRVRLAVERALPQHPLVQNPIEVLQPSDKVREQLMARLEAEVARRGQGIPHIQESAPEPTRLALRRQALLATLSIPDS